MIILAGIDIFPYQMDDGVYLVSAGRLKDCYINEM